MKNKYLLAILSISLLLSFSCTAQESGSFTINGQTQKLDKIDSIVKPLPNVTVTVFKDGEKFRTAVTSKKRADFEFTELEYGHSYKVVFKYPSCSEMYMVVDASIPIKKRSFLLGFGSNYILYDSTAKNINQKNSNILL